MKMIFCALALMVSGGFAFAHGNHDSQKMAHLVFAGGALHAHLTWEKGPLVMEESVLLVQWMNGQTHTPTELPGNFEVSVVMPSMGHGSAPTQIQRVADEKGNPIPGAFEVSNIYFVMGGEWQVDFTVHFEEGSSETQSLPVKLDNDDQHLCQ